MRLAIVFLLLALAAACSVRQLEERRPQDLPWTPLRIEDPVGRMTRMKIARLADDPAACRALLAGAGVAAAPVADRQESPDCGWEGAVRLSAPELAAPDTTVTCPAALSLAIWRRQVVEPAARRHLATELTAPTHFGSYSCRRLYGRESGSFSEHARANAIDISGFTFQGGRRVTLARDWDGTPEEQAFLREVRDGACDLFGTTLSPDYNGAHADHFHLDMGRWGGFGGVCR